MIRREGILVGGNWIIDQIKVVDAFPEEEKLVNILSEYSSNGGSPYNILKNMVKLKVDFPLSGVGLVGDDERGSQIIQECQDLGIDCSQILKVQKASTAYTVVMTVESTGKRTFFHQRGANAFLDIDHFNFSHSSAKIFHLGYLLLLDKLDAIEEDGSTRATKVFQKAKSQGFITSADIISENSGRYSSVISSLEFIDYLFVNEYEAGMITGIQTLTREGQLSLDNCYLAAKKLIELGVGQWAILHFPTGAIAVSSKGEEHFHPCVNVPAIKIQGAVGAGDAFAAGTLMGIHNGQEMRNCLKLGVCAAAASLFAATSSDGVTSAEDCLSLSEIYGFRDKD